jgi:short-subunit dehydrogenase
MKDWESYGPWALVVGASEGLGASFAEQCARRGLNVALVARRQSALQKTASEIGARYPVETREIIADAGSPDFAAKVLDAISDIEIGLFIFNAAAEPGGRFIDISIEDHLNNITVNCIAPTMLTHALAGLMAKRGRGGIVLVSSTAALQGLKQWVSYGAAKSYELLLGEGLWDELRDHGIDALTYVVGATYTPTFQQIQKKLGLPFADTIDPADFAPGTAIPQTPQVVAARLFDHLEDGPRVYANIQDQQKAEGDGRLSRREVVENMGKMTELFYKGGLNDTKS